ncbi:MAG: Ig domain-containing protein, partial [Candidatus Sungiibacteriota bacterium]
KQRRGADTIRRLGLDIVKFLRANPMLARETDFSSTQIATETAETLTKLGRTINAKEAAQRLAWKRVRDLSGMDLGILETDLAKEQMLEFAKPSNLSELMRINPARGRELNNFLTVEPTRMHDMLNRMDEGAIRYFRGTVAGELGWQLPSQIPPIIAASPTPPASIATGAYRFIPRVNGGTASFWTVAGALPPGLRIDTATGEIDGVPTTQGTYTFSMEAVDAGTGMVSPPRSFTIEVKP